jgi:uncharacterized protein YkwD
MMQKIVLVLILVLVGCGTQQPTTTAPPKEVPPTQVDMLHLLLDAHNAARTQNGVKPVASNPMLMLAALKHATWMDQHKTMSHTGPNGSTFADRIHAEGYVFNAGGENIAAGYTSVAQVMVGWMNSPGHRANILNATYTEIGVGVSGNYWCTVFARPLHLSGNALIEPRLDLPDGLTWDKRKLNQDY